MNYFRNAISNTIHTFLNILVRNFPQMTKKIPDQFKRREMCEQAVKEDAFLFKYVADEFIAQEMCEEALSTNSWYLEYVPDELKTRKICDQAVSSDP